MLMTCNHVGKVKKTKQKNPNAFKMKYVSWP